MLTPAEELGLSGLSLASRVRKAFYQIPEDRLAGLIQQISLCHGLREAARAAESQEHERY